MSNYITLPQLPTGRALFAFEQMRARLPADAAILPQLDAAQDAALTLRALEAKWRAGSDATSGARGEAYLIDREIDRVIADLAQLCTVLGRLGAAHPQGVAALAFTERFFPNGVQAMIQAVFEEELRQVEAMLAAIEAGPAAAWVEALPVASYIEALRALAPRFRAELEKPLPSPVPFDEVRAERRAAHAELELLVAGVYFLMRDDPTREAVLAPLTFQVERHRALRRSRRNVTIDIDPQTGTEVDAPMPAEA